MVRAIAWCAVLALAFHMCAAVSEGEVEELKESWSADDEAHDKQRQEADLPPPKTPTPWHMPEEGVVKGAPRNSFPNKMALRGAEGARLHDATSLIADMKNSGEWEAEEYPYPGNGKMSAEDTKTMLDSVRGPLAMIAVAKEADYKMDKQRMELSKKTADSLIASIAGGAKGSRLLTGAFPQQLGIMKGNLGNCQKRLQLCKSDPIIPVPTAAAPAKEEAPAGYSALRAAATPAAAQSEVHELGESSNPVADVGPDVSLRPTKLKPCYTPGCLVDTKTTAVEDYNKEHDENRNDILENVKAKPLIQAETTTAYQDYAKQQSGGSWDRLDGEPGMKLPQDRLPGSHLKALVADTANVIARQEKLDKEEDVQDLAKVKKAALLALDAEASVAKARQDMMEFNQPMTTDAMLSQMSMLNTKLNTCMEDVLSVCNDGKPFEMAEAASTVADVLDKRPSPRDSPEHNPVEGGLLGKVHTQGGDGGSTPISPGQDASDTPQ